VRTGPLPRGSSAVWVVPSLKLLPQENNEGTSSVRHPQLTAGCPEYLQYGRLLYVALAFLAGGGRPRISQLASEGCHSTGQLDMSDKQTTLSNDTLEMSDHFHLHCT
jgi:hypothetical protein